MHSPIVTLAPQVWNHQSVLWLAPSLEAAIQASRNLSEQFEVDGWDSEPLKNEALAELIEFYDASRNLQTGLEAYQERLANGATVEPFGVIE